MTALLLLSLLADVDGGAATLEASTMQIEVAGVRSAKGHVLIAVYRAVDRFSEAGSTAFRKERVPASAGTMTVEVKDLPGGTYSLALIHDENDNLKLDTGLFGLPTEGYCFSKGAMGVFGPPSFKDAAIQHTVGSAAQKLVVKY